MPVHYSLMQVQPVPLPTSPTHEPRFYVIRHATRFRYSSAISESVMELRMCPRTATHQRTLSFHASTNPRAQLFEYTDHLQNIVHHFTCKISFITLTSPASTNNCSLTSRQSFSNPPHWICPQALLWNTGKSWTKWCKPAIIGKCSNRAILPSLPTFCSLWHRNLGFPASKTPSPPCVCSPVSHHPAFAHQSGLSHLSIHTQRHSG